MKRPIGRRALCWGLWAIAGIAALAAAALTVLFATPAGARWALSIGLARSPVPVSIGTIEGPLRGPLVLSDVEAEREGLQVHADRVVLDWRPLGLLRRRLVIDSLQVEGLVADVRAGIPTGGQKEQPKPDPTPGPPTVPDLPVPVEVRSLRLNVERVTVEDVGEIVASSLTGRGSLEAFDMELELRGKAGSVVEFNAVAHVEGTPDAYELRGEVEIAGEDLLPVAGWVEADGSLTGIRIHEARLETASGVASLELAADWYPKLRWELTADADGFEVAPFTPTPGEWPGAVSFRVSSAGSVTDDGPQGSVTMTDLSGNLRGRPVAGSMEARAVPGRVDVDTLGLSWGRSRVDAAGVVGAELDLAFELDVPDLGIAVPGGEGSLRADGTLSGTRDEPRVEAGLEAVAVRAGTVMVDRASGTVRLDLAPGASSDVEIAAAGLSLGDRRVDSLSLVGSGTPEAHAAILRARAESGRLAVSASGGLMRSTGTASTWIGRLDSLLVSADPAGEWRLAGSPAVALSPDSVSIDEACLARDASEVCATGSWSRAGPVRVAYRVVTLPLALLQESLPENVAIDGTVEGEGRIEVAADGALAGEGSLRARGAIESRIGSVVYRFRIAGQGIEFVLDEAGARASLGASLTQEGGPGDATVDANIEWPGYASTEQPFEEQALHGGIRVRSDDLSFLAALRPEVQNAAGALRLEADLSGSVAEPTVMGRVDLTDGAVDLPELGLELREVRLTGSGEPDGSISLSGSVRSGEGRIEIEGRTPAIPGPDTPAEIRATGERFLAVGTPEIQVEIAPDLTVRYDGEVTRVEGRVDVPWARIELVEVPPSAVSPSGDVVFAGEEEAATPPVEARIEIRVGDDVRFDGFGFGSFIEGELRVREEPGREPLVLGELRFIDGRYTAYGQNLTIDPGRIVFSGPVEDARLDVTALRRAGDGTEAGFIVTGGIEAPDIRITSDPAMSDVEALSYIMYGKNLNEGNASQQEAVTGAVATLGANVLTTQLAGKVGLDEARIEGTTREQAEFVAGKYLTPSLFVSYGIGLFEPTNTFRIKYLLSSHWALQAESGDANGGDVLYQVELGGIGSAAGSRD